MKYVGMIKKALWGALAAGIVLGSSVEVYCTEDWYNDTNVQEHISKVEEQLKAAGYTLNRTMGNTNTGQSTSTDSASPKQESEKTVKKCDHSYVDSVIKEPTCADPGMMESKCSKCGDTYKTEIPATGKHEYSSEVTKEATCTEKGETTYTCAVCGDSYTEEIPAKGHSYEASVTKNATCTESGINTFKCSDCGDSYTEEIQALGHTEVEEVTKTSGMFTSGEKVIKCSTCGEILATEVLPSRYPLSALLIALGVILVAVGAASVIFIKKKKEMNNKTSAA